MKTQAIVMALCLLLPSALAAPSNFASRDQASLTETCSTANGIRRCCPGQLNMRVNNGKLSGHCCVPVGKSKRDNDAMRHHARAHIAGVARDERSSCPQGQVAVSVTARDYEKRIADLMRDGGDDDDEGDRRGAGAGPGHTSGGGDRANPFPLAGAMGLLAAAGM